MKKAEVKKEKKKNALKEYWPLYLMMLPALLYLLINNYIPMAGMVIAFKKLNFAKGIWASPWAGLKNFKFLFASKDAWIITRNTLLYNVAFILVNMVVGIAIAILITEIRNTKLKKIYQSAILLPFLMSMVILSYIVYALLSAENGLVNNSILPLFHIINGAYCRTFCQDRHRFRRTSCKYSRQLHIRILLNCTLYPSAEVSIT